MPQLNEEERRKLDELDFAIDVCEKELRRLNEARREFINYHGLNKNESDTKRK